MKEADNTLFREVEKHKTPSVQYLIFDKDRIIHQFQYGMSDIGNNVRTSFDTTYNAYSVTKTFTALAVLQLQKRTNLTLIIRQINICPTFHIQTTLQYDSYWHM